LSAFQPPTVLQDSVLVVDDDQATRDSLASVLKGAGIEVFVASDPGEAFTLRGLQRPAAIVVDHQLSDHTGVELAQRLKEEDPDTPVLLLTGLASLDSALAASAQLDGLLVKPLVPQAFIQTVRNALARLKALGILNWVRRCAESWRDGKFCLEQETNAYAVLPSSQWRGYREPPEAPPPVAGTWGDHPPLPSLLAQAAAEGQLGGSLRSVIGILDCDPGDALAQALARLGRAVQNGNPQ